MNAERARIGAGLSIALLMFAAGCTSSVQVKSSSEGDAAQDNQAAVATPGPAGPQGKGIGNVVRSGPPQVTFPGFDVLPDGRSVITVQVSGNTDVTAQKSEGRLVYFLKGVGVPEKVNRLPLVSTNFASQVSRVQVEPTDGGANVIVELREATTETHTLSKIEGGTLLTVVLPKSEKFGDQGMPKNGANAKTGDGAADDDTTQGDGRHHRRKGRKSEAELEKEDKADDSDFKRGSGDDEEAEHARRWKRKIRQPVPYVERHITLSYRTLAPDIGVSFNGFGKGNPAVYLMSGFHLGIVDQFEIELTPNAWRLAPHGGYYFPSFGATWNFVQTHVFDMAVRARFFIPVDTGATAASGLGKPHATLAGGVPLIFHLGTIAKIDTGAIVTIPFGGASSTGSAALTPAVGSSPSSMGLYDLTASPYYVDPGIPLKLVFQPADAAFVGVTTGLSIFDFKSVSRTAVVPLGFQVGVTTTSNKKPAADFGVKFDWKRFFQPGVDGDHVEAKDYELAAWLRWYYYM